MIGLILLTLSWILLKFENKGLTELGFNRPAARISEFTIGFFLAGSFAGGEAFIFIRK